jgi:hypothetical protein
VLTPYVKPPYLFDPHNPAIIAESLDAMQKLSFDARTRELEELESLYEGGADVSKFLLRNDAESDKSFSARQKRLCHPNYVQRIVDELVDDVYGDEVVRSFGPEASDDQNEALKQVYRKNRMRNLAPEVCRSQVLLGDGWINAAWQEEPKNVGLFAVHPLDMWSRQDPDNPSRLYEVAERRRSDRTDIPREKDTPAFTCWVWNREFFFEVDMHGRFLTPVTPNRYGVIPYIRWRGRSVVGREDGLSFVRDAATIQRLLLNRISDEDKLIRYQTHGLMVVNSIDEPVIKSGADSFLRLTNTDDKAYFINPGADIAAVQETIRDLKDSIFEISSVPSSLIVGGQASSGLQLLIEMRPLTRVVGAVRSLASVGEEELITVIAAISVAHGDTRFPRPDTLEPTVEFSDNFLPSDKQAEFDRDMAMLGNVPPLITIEDVLLKWHAKLRKSPEALRAYMEQLERDSQAASKGQVGSGGVGTTGSTTPPVTPPATPPAAPQTPGGGKLPVEQAPPVGSDGLGL